MSGIIHEYSRVRGRKDRSPAGADHEKDEADTFIRSYTSTTIRAIQVDSYPSPPHYYVYIRSIWGRVQCNYSSEPREGHARLKR